MAQLNPFSLKKRAESFRYAFAGLRRILLKEHNFRIQLGAAIIAVAAGIIVRITLLEWTVLILAICLVLVAEILNTALEDLADFVHPEKHEMVKRVKDYGAAAVLLASAGALGTGAFILLPRIFRILSG